MPDRSCGDLDALGALYDAHAPALLAVATRILGSGQEAEDLVHDVFLEVWQRGASYDPQRGTLRTWLLVRLRSRAIDRLRSRSARWALLCEEPVEEAALPVEAREADPSRAPDWRRVRLELAGVTERQREVLELAYFEGLSLREIAERCGIPLGTAKSRMAGAVAALRRRLAGAHPGPLSLRQGARL